MPACAMNDNSQKPGGPPPIPVNQKPADPAAAYRAANWSVGLPFLCILISLAVSEGVKATPGTSTLVTQIGAFAAIAATAAGLLLAIKALCFKGGYMGERPVVRPILGILLNTGFVALFAFGFVRGFQRAVMARKAAAGMHAAAREIDQDMKQASAENRTVSHDQAQANLEKMKSSLDGVAQNLSGPNAAVARASSAYLGRLQPLTTNYIAALNSLTHPSLTDMSAVKERAQLEPRKKLIRQFMVANDQLEAFVTNRMRLYRDELRRSSLSDQEIASAIFVVAKALPADFNEVAHQIREDDRRIARALLGMLNLLDADFGKWKWNASRQKVEFDNPVELDKFIGLRDELTTAAKEQHRLQLKMMDSATQ
jgi:hypothetical protein